MLRLFLSTTGRFTTLAVRTYLRTADGARETPNPSAPPCARSAPSARRMLVMSAFLPVFALVQGIHWLGFLLDEVLFRGYRRVVVREPLFVLGVPRSGTTALHRALAADPRLTTFSTWECLFAPSVTERRFWMGLARLDARLGRPLARLLSRIEERAFSGMEGIHSMRLSDPEEDYFCLTPVLASFILVLPFAHSRFVWRMGAFDRDMPEPERSRLMDFYHRCLQKHLYVHGPDRRLLSKNAAFAPLAGSLRARFPDGRFLICVRPPEQTLPSQLSSLGPGIRFFDVTSVVPDFRERLTRQIGFYYRNLLQTFSDVADDRCAWVTMDALKRDLAKTLTDVYRQLGMTMDPRLRAWLEQASPAARGYRSGHHYSLAALGLSAHDIERDLGQIYASMNALASQGEARTLGDCRTRRMPGESRDPSPTREPAPPC